jgi:aminodeoxyfutalosine deaminase
MRKISADYIFPVSSPPVKNGVVVVDDNGIITSAPEPLLREREDIERYEGIIVPGFVNTHCHLELSHLKGEISERKGLTDFISELIPKRDKFSLEQIKAAIASAEEEMLLNGIVAVGDISNTDHSFDQKRKNALLYHTFIEAFDFNAEQAQRIFDTVIRLQTSNTHLHTSITPHAPYTVSGKLMELIDNLKQPLLSIHNQETVQENELFLSGTGPLAGMMKRVGVDVDSKRRARGSLFFTFGGLLESKKILLVHNTYTSREDIDLIRQYTQGTDMEVVLCLCPRANLYIENSLPDIPMFVEAGMKLTLGTDSYASNWSLSILDEIKVISKHFPAIPFEILISWATKNGAEFLGMQEKVGTIEKGKKPGLNLIQGMDMQAMKLADGARMNKLL